MASLRRNERFMEVPQPRIQAILSPVLYIATIENTVWNETSG
jgi:hypothetical protein